MKVQFKRFVNRKLLGAFEDVAQQATEFASQLAPEQLISISHSQAMTTVVAIVWYWSDEAIDGPAA